LVSSSSLLALPPKQNVLVAAVKNPAKLENAPSPLVEFALLARVELLLPIGSRAAGNCVLLLA